MKCRLGFACANFFAQPKLPSPTTLLTCFMLYHYMLVVASKNLSKSLTLRCIIWIRVFCSSSLYSSPSTKTNQAFSSSHHLPNYPTTTLLYTRQYTDSHAKYITQMIRTNPVLSHAQYYCPFILLLLSICVCMLCLFISVSLSLSPFHAFVWTRTAKLFYHSVNNRRFHCHLFYLHINQSVLYRKISLCKNWNPQVSYSCMLRKQLTKNWNEMWLT